MNQPLPDEVRRLRSQVAALEQLLEVLEQSVLQQTERLTMEKERMRAIVTTALDGIVTIDPWGRIEEFNPAAERLFGYKAEEVKGRNVNLLMPSPYREEHDQYLENYRHGGIRKIIGIGREVLGLRKDGTTFPLELSVSESRVGTRQMFTGILHDLTERKRMERIKSEFISTVSHELRTPLTSIRGALNLVMGRDAANIPEKSRRLLEMAERNSQRLTLLINDILDLEKIEGGQMLFDFRSVDLVDLASRSLAENEGFAASHQVSLVLRAEIPQAPVRGDEHRLLQVLANLISNAVKFSPKGGTVEVRVRGLDRAFQMAVKDEGAGIPEHFRDRIFQRFSQADASDAREKGGTGLGLSITKAIVERHAGSIDFLSASGQGTEFQVQIPALADTLASDLGKGPRVLICEDDLNVASVYAEILATERLPSDRTSTLEGARKCLSDRSYHLLLLDLSLPDGDGLTFLEELRGNPATAQLPVIVASGRSPGGASGRGSILSVADWLHKPVDPQRLLAAVRTSIGPLSRPRILHVEDDPDVLQLVKALLEEFAEVAQAGSLEQAQRLLASGPCDLVILDLGLPDGSGLELLRALKASCPVVIFSAQPPGRRTSEDVVTVLTKSMTTNDELLAAIKAALSRTGAELGVPQQAPSSFSRQMNAGET